MFVNILLKEALLVQLPDVSWTSKHGKSLLLGLPGHILRLRL